MNQWRSPTAETLFRKHADYSVRSAGTRDKARRRVTAKDLQWADIIFVMEQKHKQRLKATYGSLLQYKTLHVLDIEDNYQYMDEELVRLLTHSIEHLLDIQMT